MIIIVGVVPSHTSIEIIRNLEKKTIEYIVEKYNSISSREVWLDISPEDVQIIISFNTTMRQAHVTIYATKHLKNSFLKRFVDMWAQHLQAKVTGIISRVEPNEIYSARSGC